MKKGPLIVYCSMSRVAKTPQSGVFVPKTRYRQGILERADRLRLLNPDVPLLWETPRDRGDWLGDDIAFCASGSNKVGVTFLYRKVVLWGPGLLL